jgi:manganese oxidase
MRISPIPIGIAIISTAFAVIIAVSSGAYKGINSIMSSAQTSDSDNESGPNVIGSHTPGYPIATTSGSILDPLQTAVDDDPVNAVVDPMQ